MEGRSLSAAEWRRERSRHGARATASSQAADARADASLSALVSSCSGCGSPGESVHRLSLAARGAHARRSRAARWQTAAPSQSASLGAALAWIEVSGNLTGSKQPIAKGTARAVRRVHQY